jgi:hypothetical protein
MEDVLKLMWSQKVDFTRFFRALSAGTARTLFADPELSTPGPPAHRLAPSAHPSREDLPQPAFIPLPRGQRRRSGFMLRGIYNHRVSND